MSTSIRTVELARTSGGFGFTLSSQGPCVLSCILASSPAHKAGLKPGDQILYVNGMSVERYPHEQVVKLIARSPDGRVNLGVRNRVSDSSTKTTTNTTASPAEHHDTDEEEAAMNNAILNRVDKVVEELKSGQLLINTPAAIRRSLSSTTDGVTSISEDDIVSDDELKASFNENVFIDSPSDSVFSENIFGSDLRVDSRGSSETAEIAATKLNRVLYPALTPARTAPDMPLHRDDKIEPDFRAIVGYLGSIELPFSSSLQTASLNAIRGCVRRLRAQQKVHVMFLLEVSVLGVQLIDSGGKTVVTYPIKSLAFTGICSDDNKVFGIVTRKSNDNNRPNSWHSSHFDRLDAQSAVNCSCHVFSVDSDIVAHEAHYKTAEKFHIKCTTSRDGCECVEFQNGSLPILNAISSLFRERTSSEAEMDELRTRSRSLSSCSQSESDASSSDRHRGMNVNRTSKGNHRPNIRVNIFDGIDNGFMHERSNSDPEIYEEPFRHRSIQVQRVSPLMSRKEIDALEKMEHKNYAERNMNKVDGNKANTVRYLSSSRDPVVTVSKVNDDGQEMSLTSSPDSLADSAMSQGSVQSYPSDTDLIKPSISIGLEPLNGVDKKMDQHISQSYESLNHTDGAELHPKPIHLSPSISSSTQSLHSISSMPGDMSALEGRVSLWAQGFDKLMDDQAGLRCFEEFLKKEFSEENIVFWIACEDFRMLSDPKKLKTTATNIFDAHLSPNASMPVNIDSSAVKLAEEHLANPTNDMYRLQQQQVYTLMKFDSYPRFLKSDLYRQCLMCEVEGMNLPFEEPDLDDKANKSRFFKKQSGRSWGRRSSKKSSGSHEESKTPGDKMRSLLPWKGKQGRKGSRAFDSQPSSARSSMSSLSDSHNISHSTESLEGRRENESMHFCRIVLPDHSSTIVSAKHGQTLLETLTYLCERRHMSLATMGIYLGGSDKPAQPKEMEMDMSHFSNKEVILEHRSLFRLELPDGQVLGVKTRPDQSVRSCLEPILKRHKIDFSTANIHVANCNVPLDCGVPVASIEHQDVIVEIEETANKSVTSKPPLGFTTGPRRASRRGSGWDDSIFDDIVRGKKQSLGSGYFDDTGVWVPGLKPFRSQESLGDSFGKSFLRGPGLFGRKRKEAMEVEKSVTVRSGQQAQKNNEVKEMMELLRRAQGKRMDDQRGQLSKNDFELPDFLRAPGREHANTEVTYNGPTTPPHFRRGSLKNRDTERATRPVVRKTVSSPSMMLEQMNFMNELSARLTKRTDHDQEPISEALERDEMDDEGRDETPTNSRREEGYSPWEPRKISEHRRINVVRPRASTDGAVFTVEAVTPVRLSSDSMFEYQGLRRPNKLIHSESVPNIVAPPTRTEKAQPLTVNTIRGLYTSTGNLRDASTEGGRDKLPKWMKYSMKNPSPSSMDSSRNAPYVYEAPPNEFGSIPESSRTTGKIRDIAKENRTRGPYYLPEANAEKAEVHVPSSSTTALNSRYRPTIADKKPRPRPIVDQSSLIARLEDDRRALTDLRRDRKLSEPGESMRVISPTFSDISSASGSPLPLPPTPPREDFELDLADFPPPTPLCPTGNKKPRSRLSQLQAELTPELINKTITPASANDKTFTGESADDATPIAAHKPSINDISKKLSTRPQEESRRTNRGESGKPVRPKLDPYVTYETDDLRITFV